MPIIYPTPGGTKKKKNPSGRKKKKGAYVGRPRALGAAFQGTTKKTPRRKR